MLWNSFFYFISVWRTPFCCSLRLSLLGTGSLRRVSDLQSTVFFRHLKSSVLLSLCFRGEVYCRLDWCSLRGNMPPFLTAFKICLSLVFRSLIMLGLVLDFFGFTPLLESGGLCLLLCFQEVFSQYFSPVSLSLLCFSSPGAPLMWLLDPLIQPTGLFKNCICSSPCARCCSYPGNAVDLSSSSQFCLLSPPLYYHICYCIFSSAIFTQFFL